MFDKLKRQVRESYQWFYPKSVLLKGKRKIIDRKLTYGPALAVLAIIVIYVIANIITSLLLLIYPLIKGWDSKKVADWISNSVVIQSVSLILSSIIVAYLLWWFLRRRKQKLTLIGVKKIKAKDPLFAIVAFVGYLVTLTIAILVISNVLPVIDTSQKQEIFTAPVAGWLLIFAFVPLVLIAPVVEEFMFRGFLFTGLRSKLSFWPSALIVSILFGVLHLSGSSGGPLWIAAIDTLVLSIFLCFIREKTDSLWSSVLLHSLKNLVAFIGVFVLA